MVYMQIPHPATDESSESLFYDSLEKQSIPSAVGPKRNSKPGWLQRTTPTSLSKEEIVSSIEFLNANYEILNVDKYGSLEDVEAVIVVQVHDRIEYLRELISTLEAARYISSTLLIFSHDYSSAALNKLVKGIRFCRVMQIFYPYNIQLFPNVYPGQDPRDCPDKATRMEAENLKCNNWEHPDKYGHFRIAKLTQIKHHWWWKMNYVFDGVLKQYGLTKAWVILLEEDHYVSPDFLHVMRLIVNNKLEYCAECQVISLGLYLKRYNNFAENLDRLGIHPWFSSKHNMGMAINSSTWALIKNCTKMFCTYDDYNWDWSLLQVSTKCLPTRLRVIVVKAPRVLHVGDCGVHTHRCAVYNAAQMARELFENVADSLFPEKMKVVERMTRTMKPSKENGGWGDTRDHELCLNNSHVPDLAAYDFYLRSSAGALNNNNSIASRNVSHSVIVQL